MILNLKKPKTTIIKKTHYIKTRPQYNTTTKKTTTNHQYVEHEFKLYYDKNVKTEIQVCMKTQNNNKTHNNPKMKS